MICKTDVILWFKELESYKRIDTMCTLLNMCLPFELRFLGTCLEELGRRDSQELRGMELRVNNPQDLAADMVACQKGEPTDKKIRRKMALYLALIRACNRTCVTEIFRTLDGWGNRDFFNMNDSDTLQELLLVYTMAANHPVFSFEQHMKCTEIFEKIKENKIVWDQPIISPAAHQIIEQHSIAQDLRQSLQSHPEILQQLPMHAMHLGGQQLVPTGSIQIIPPQGSIAMNFPQTHLTKLITAEGNIQHSIPVESIPHMISSNITIPTDSNTIMAHPNTAWSLRHFPSQTASIEHPPQPSSPMLSQQSSPSSSRTTSPSRTASSNLMLQPNQGRNISQRIVGSMKGIRRPSTETTPPPMGQQQTQSPQLSHAQITNEIILPSNIKHIDDVGINTDASGNQLQSLIRNGFTRSGHHSRLKVGNYISPHQQSSINQHFQNLPPTTFAMNAGLPYSMQNMSISDSSAAVHSSLDGAIVNMNSNKSAGSDSGSSIGSPGTISPSETPTLMSNAPMNSATIRMNNEQPQTQQKHLQTPLIHNKQMNLMRLNGRSSVVSNVHHTLAQPQQIFSNNEIILAPGGNAGTTNMLQTTLANNNNSGVGSNIAIANTNSNAVSSNNNITSNTVLLSSPSGAGAAGSILGNVITSNSVLLQSPQQQYNASYPYHAAAAQHLGPTSRQTLMTHNPSLAPPGPFRLSSFQLPPNGELIYPPYHPASITFLPSGAPPGTSPVALRSSNSVAVSSNASVGVQPTHISQQPPPPQQMQPTQSGVPSAAILASSLYNTLTVGVTSKPISCYNCGSQTHSGRDCQEASMDDVTRSAIYKLDYSVSASSNVSPTTNSGTNLSIGGSSSSVNALVANASDNLQQQSSHQKHHSIDMSNIPSTTVASSSISAATNAINIK